MATFEKGEHVLADFGDGYVVAHMRKADPVTNAAGETKYVVQAPDGSAHELAYRETHDVQASGGVTGLTFKKV